MWLSTLSDACSRARDEPGHAEHGHEADGDVDEEQVPPPVVGAGRPDDEPADDRPGGRRHRDGGAEDAERAGPLGATEEVLDEPGVLRREQAGGRALDEPGDDDERHVRREPDRRAGDDEADQADEHHPAAAVRVAEPPAGYEGQAEGRAGSPETTHWIALADVSSPCCIDGIATLTMETSSSDMKPTTSDTDRIRQRRGSGTHSVPSGGVEGAAARRSTSSVTPSTLPHVAEDRASGRSSMSVGCRSAVGRLSVGTATLDR